jgi:hypothetical protein
MVLHDLEPEIKNNKVNELTFLLKVFHPKLGFILSTAKQDYELTITAHGNPYLFKSVELLVKYAPTIKDWKISGFIPPLKDVEIYKNGIDYPFLYHGISLRISEMKYTVMVNDSNPLLVSLNVYIRNYITHSDNEYLLTAIYILLEHLLGEKSFANEIHFVMIAQITNELEQNNKLVDLYHLPAFIALTRKMSAEELS